MPKIKRDVVCYYRVIRVTKYGYNDSRDTKEIVWEGWDRDELSTLYRLRVLDGRLDDPLARTANMATGSTTHYHFEVWVGPDVFDGADGSSTQVAGYWRESSDPRYRSPAVCELDSTLQQ